MNGGAGQRDVIMCNLWIAKHGRRIHVNAPASGVLRYRMGKRLFLRDTEQQLRDVMARRLDRVIGLGSERCRMQKPQNLHYQ